MILKNKGTILIFAFAFLVSCKKGVPENPSVDGVWILDSITESYPHKSGVLATYVYPPPPICTYRSINITGSTLTFIPDPAQRQDTMNVNTPARRQAAQYASFQVKQTGVSRMHVSWKTFRPSNLDHLYYELQWSTDGKVFWRYATQTTRDYLTDTINYDNNVLPLSAHYYYRLKIIHMDNTYTLSPILDAKWIGVHELTGSNGHYNVSLPYPLNSYFQNLEIIKESKTNLKIKSRATNIKWGYDILEFKDLEFSYRRK